MKAVGIIAEYNPFHTGHAYQLARTREALGPDTAVVAVMSGNWVQGAGPACADKWLRTRLALTGGADLVLELPTVWAVSSAETFAWGGVSLLQAAGVVTDLSFGSECGDTEALKAVAGCLDSPVYDAGLRRFLNEGMPFAACRQAVAAGLLGRAAGELLSGPNNNLGVEYLRALGRLGSSIRPMTVQRAGSAHNGPAEPGAAFASATHIRELLAAESWEAAAAWLPAGEEALLRKAVRPDRALLDRLFLSRLRMMTAEDWARLPDSAPEEGLPERLARAGRQAVSLEEFYQLVKTKRYTHARVRRLALWAFLGLEAADRPERPPYLRVLGCSERGRELLREMKDRAALPVITKPAHARNLPEPGRRLFELESRCTDLYGLCLPVIPAGGREWTENPVIAPE